jgi:pimeloyl-ACP methyl ester carboxylesterase
MARYVLVHGAWHGGWCWQRVAPRLRAAGHEVLTPTLTGLGERVHLAQPSVNLSTHVSDIVNVCRFEDLSNIVLVGHSYAGFVVSGVADRCPGHRSRQSRRPGRLRLDRRPPGLAGPPRGHGPRSDDHPPAGGRRPAAAPGLREGEEE